MATVGAAKYTYDVIESWGTLPEGWTFGNVASIAVDSQDRVYAFQRKDPPIVIFDRDGVFLGSWGDGAIAFGHGIYIGPDDHVYLTDWQDHMTLKFTLDGKPLLILGNRGQPSDTGCEEPSGKVLRAAGPFNMPAQMVTSPSGNLYVSDGYRNCRIHRFTPQGQLIASWGDPGKVAPNEFHVPHCVWVDSEGTVFGVRPGQQPHPGLQRDRGVHHDVDGPVSPHFDLHGRGRDRLRKRARARRGGRLDGWQDQRVGQERQQPGASGDAWHPLDLRRLPRRPLRC